jgi:hypothetical protein
MTFCACLLNPEIIEYGTLGPWLGWHSFRRTLATLLQSSGASVKTTQDFDAPLLTCNDSGNLCKGGNRRQATHSRCYRRIIYREGIVKRSSVNKPYWTFVDPRLDPFDSYSFGN